MAYDEDLADRIRDVLDGAPDVSERRMFGGLAFLVEGHMAVTASGQGGLMVRVDPAQSDSLVDGTSVSRVVMRGREMDGWLRVATEDLGTEAELRTWVERGLARARLTPPG